MYEKLNLYKNPLCSIATVHDNLLLNGYKIDERLIYLACIKTFLIFANSEVKGIPLYFVAPIENEADLKYFKKIGLDIKNVDLQKALKDSDSQNIIAYFDYYTLYAKDAKKKKYNISPIHTSLIIEKENNDWMMNEVDGDNGTFIRKNLEQLLIANSMECYPYPLNKTAYQIIPSLDSKEIEKRTISLIDDNLNNIFYEAQNYKGVIKDDSVNLFYGLQAYDELLNFFVFLKNEYEKGVTVEKNKRYSILLMTFRRFLLPLSGSGTFFRYEMADAFKYYSDYKKNSTYGLIGNKLLITGEEWKEIGKIVTSICTKKDKYQEIIIIINKLKEIKKIELEAINELYKIL